MCPRFNSITFNGGTVNTKLNMGPVAPQKGLLFCCVFGAVVARLDVAATVLGQLPFEVGWVGCPRCIEYRSSVVVLD